MNVRDHFLSLAGIFINQALKLALNYTIEVFGKVLELNIDNCSRKVDLKILLNGEKDPLMIVIDGYTLHADNTIEVNSISADRAWINDILARFVAGRKIVLSPLVASVVRTIAC